MKLVASAAAAVLVAFVAGCAGPVSMGPTSFTPSIQTGGVHAPGLAAANPVNLNVGVQPMYVGGLPNLYKVNDSLYRGGKPEGGGYAQLKEMGVRTVIDLGYQIFEVDNQRDPAIRYERIPFYTYSARDDQVIRFLQIVSDPAAAPVYVHCRKGADRTGFMVAVYRVAVCGWDREKAIQEMTEGGYGFDRTYQNLIDYVRTADIPALARQAGIQTKAPAAKVAQAPLAKAVLASLVN